MKVSKGRIVFYKYAGGEYPAIVTIVNDDETVNLCVFAEPLFYVHNVPEGEDRGQWSWPPRV